jgi:hypothetical protein
MQNSYTPMLMVVGKEHHIQAVVLETSRRRFSARYEAFNTDRFRLMEILRSGITRPYDALLLFASAMSDHGIRFLRFLATARERRSLPRIRTFVVFTHEQREHRPRITTYYSCGMEAPVFIANLNNAHEVTHEVNSILGRLLPPSNG